VAMDAPVGEFALVPLGTGNVGRLTVPLKVGGQDRPLAAGETLIVNLEPPIPGLSSRFTVSSLRPANLTLRSVIDGLTGIGVGQASGFRFSQRFDPIFRAN